MGIIKMKYFCDVLMEQKFLVPCEILSRIEAYGHTRYKVRPIGGSGEHNIDSTRAQNIKGEKVEA